MRPGVLAALLVIILMGGAGAGGSSGVLKEQGLSRASPATPAFSFWFLSLGMASCSLSTGVCTMAIANEGMNSSYDLVLAVGYCNLDLIYANNSTGTYYTSANGTAGGQIMNGLTFGANVVATCTVPTTQLALEPNGWTATGSFIMKLVNSLGSVPSGRTAGVQFGGTWTTSPATKTSTITSTVTSITTSVQITSTTLTMTETTSETQTVTKTTTSVLAGSQSASVILYGLAALVGFGVAIAALFIARRVSKG